MPKLTPMDIQQRRIIQRVYKPGSRYVRAWRGYISRKYRVNFGRAQWSTNPYTKRWFSTFSNKIIYSVYRGKRRFIKCA